MFKAFFQHFMKCSMFKKLRFFFAHPLMYSDSIVIVIVII